MSSSFAVDLLLGAVVVVVVASLDLFSIFFFHIAYT